MSVPTKQIAVYTRDSQDQQVLTVQNYGVEAEVVGVSFTLSEEEVLAKMAQLTEELKAHLSDECTAVYHAASQFGLGEVFMELLDALDTNLSAKIPSVFRGELRKRIGAICMKMRTLMNNPELALKGALTKTSEGYYLELWYLQESFVLYKDLVTPVFKCEAAPVVAPAPAPVPVTSPLPSLLVSEPLSQIAILMGTSPIPVKRDAVPVHRARSTRQVTRELANRPGRLF